MTNLTFSDFDKFERKDFADRLTKVISTFYPFYDEAFVLSLNAEFGSGKTTFLKMWQHQLGQDGYKVLYLNAWETDFDDEPIIPIISTLLEGIGKDNETKVTKEVTTTLKAVLAVCTLEVIDTIASPISKAADKLKECKDKVKEYEDKVKEHIEQEDIQAKGEEVYEEFSYKKVAYKILKDELASYIKPLPKSPLIIFVDELDRVRPDYAVKFLEAIKHIFPVQGICFVLAVDRKHLEASVRQLYGNIDFDNYYLRFVTREAELPEVTDFRLFVDAKAIEFFDEKRGRGVKFPFKQKDQKYIVSDMSDICIVFGFRARQVSLFFRIFSQFMAITADDDIPEDTVSGAFAAIILIAIFIKDRDLYHQIGESKSSPSELEKFIDSLDFNSTSLETNDFKGKFARTIMAYSIRSNDEEFENEIYNIVSKKYMILEPYGNLSDVNNRAMFDLSRCLSGFDYSGCISGFNKIYKKLEEWESFINTDR